MKNRVVNALLVTGTNVLLLSFAVFFVMLAWMIYDPFLAPYMESLGIGDIERGIFYSLISVAQMFVVIPAGLLSDRIQRKWLITVSGLGWALVSYLYTLAQSSWQFYVLAIFQGAFTALIPPAAYALLMDQATEKTRGTVMSVYLTVINVGMIFAPTIGGMISTTTGTLATGFVWAAGFFVIGSVVALFIRKSGVGFKVAKITFPKRQMLIDTRFLSIFVATGFLAVANGLLSPVLGVYALRELKMGETLYGLFLTVFLTLITITQAVVGTLSDKFGRTSVVSITLTAYGVGLILAGFSINPWMLIVCYLPVAVGAASYSPIFYSLTGDIIPSERRGLASATLNCFYSAGMIVGPLIGAFVQSMYGNRPVYPIASLFVLMTVVFIVLSFRKHYPAEKGGKNEQVSVSTQ